MQIPKKYRACASGKKKTCRIVKEEKISSSRNQGVAKDFCVTRDGPKSSCEFIIHDTRLGITYFDA